MKCGFEFCSKRIDQLRRVHGGILARTALVPTSAVSSLIRRLKHALAMTASRPCGQVTASCRTRCDSFLASSRKLRSKQHQVRSPENSDRCGCDARV